MATKTGILSDANYMTNCEEYKPLPIGFANAHFVGNRPNPNLMGIKTPKYQRSAPRPVSADVMAVNMARMNPQGNPFATAREMLDMYIKEGKEFKPPPVQLKSLEQNLEELHSFIFSDRYEGDIGAAQGYTSLQEFIKDYYGLVNVPVPKIILQNRGDAILKQTISTAVSADLPGRGDYQAQFNTMTRDIQDQVYRQLTMALNQQGVSTSGYYLGSQPSKGDLQKNMERLLAIVYARNVVVDLDNIFGVPLASTAPQNITQLVQQISGSSSTSMGAGTSTQMSQAGTQQGTALSATTQTTQEVQKK
jgi:hypothetical protein